MLCETRFEAHNKLRSPDQAVAFRMEQNKYAQQEC